MTGSRSHSKTSEFDGSSSMSETSDHSGDSIHRFPRYAVGHECRLRDTQVQDRLGCSTRTRDFLPTHIHRRQSKRGKKPGSTIPGRESSNPMAITSLLLTLICSLDSVLHQRDVHRRLASLQLPRNSAGHGASLPTDEGSEAESGEYSA